MNKIIIPIEFTSSEIETLNNEVENCDNIVINEFITQLLLQVYEASTQIQITAKKITEIIDS